MLSTTQPDVIEVLRLWLLFSCLTETRDISLFLGKNGLSVSYRLLLSVVVVLLVQIIDGQDLLNERTSTELRYLKKACLLFPHSLLL